MRFQAIVAYPRLIAPDESTTVWSVLANGLADEDAQVRARAAEACAELANGATLPRDAADRLARLAVASDEPHDVRVAAAIALGESRDARCAPVLLDCLAGTIDEPDPRRVQAIFELVGELGLAAARPLLTQAAFGWRARLGDPSRRAAALGALVRLGERRAVEHVLAELGARSWERRLTALGVVTRTRLTEARGHVAALASHPMTSDAAAAALAALDVPKDA